MKIKQQTVQNISLTESLIVSLVDIILVCSSFFTQYKQFFLCLYYFVNNHEPLMVFIMYKYKYLNLKFKFSLKLQV